MREGAALRFGADCVNIPQGRTIGRGDAFFRNEWNNMAEFSRNLCRRASAALIVFAGFGVQSSPQAQAAEPPGKRPALYILNADGTGWRPLSEAEDYWAGSSPVVSPDGKTVVFDGWRLVEGQKQGEVKLIAIDIDGHNVREFGEGQSASWSPDGKFFARSLPGKPASNCIMTADGKEHKPIRAGWAAQWSPDGKRIAFIQGAKLMTYEVDSGEFHQVLDGGNPYKQLFWNMAWSPDGTRICIKGKRPDGSEELAIIDAAGAEFGFAVRFKAKGFQPDIAWHPRGDRVVFAMNSPESRRSQLYQLDPDFDEPPAPVAGQDESRTNYCPCWTPDGKQLIVISQ